MTREEITEIGRKIKGAEFDGDLMGYFPRAEELKRRAKEVPLEDIAPILVFYAGNPYDDNPDISKTIEYRDTVRVAEDLLMQLCPELDSNGENED